MYSKKIFAAAMMGLLSLSLAGARAAEPAAKTSQISTEQLKEMLDNLGYEVRLEKLKSGTVLHWIKILSQGTTYEINVNISSSKSKLWTSVGLSVVNPIQLGQADRMVKLLELNQKIGPTHFYYYPPHKMIYVAKPMDNRGITAKLLREHLDDFMSQISSNREHWDTSKWTDTTKTVGTEKK